MKLALCERIIGTPKPWRASPTLSIVSCTRTWSPIAPAMDTGSWRGAERSIWDAGARGDAYGHGMIPRWIHVPWFVLALGGTMASEVAWKSPPLDLDHWPHLASFTALMA